MLSFSTLALPVSINSRAMSLHQTDTRTLDIQIEGYFAMYQIANHLSGYHISLSFTDQKNHQAMILLRFCPGRSS
jgi:hypothetical protein